MTDRSVRTKIKSLNYYFKTALFYTRAQIGYLFPENNFENNDARFFEYAK